MQVECVCVCVCVCECVCVCVCVCVSVCMCACVHVCMKQFNFSHGSPLQKKSNHRHADTIVLRSE